MCYYHIHKCGEMNATLINKRILQGRTGMEKQYSKQETLEVLNSLEKEDTAITEAKYLECKNIVSQFGKDEEVAKKTRDVIKSQLPNIDISKENDPVMFMLGDLECNLIACEMEQSAQEDSNNSIIFPIYADIVNDYIREQTISKTKSENKSSSVLFITHVEFLHQGIFSDSDDWFNNYAINSVKDVYLKDKEGNYYLTNISGEVGNGYAEEQIDNIKGLVVVYDYKHNKSMVLDYDKNKPYCEVVDSGSLGQFEAVDNVNFTGNINMYISRNQKESILYSRNLENGKFEKQNIDLHGIDDIRSTDHGEAIIGRKSNKEERPTTIIWAKDKDGKFYKDTEIPTPENGEGFERVSYDDKGNLIYSSRSSFEKYTDFRYVRTKNGQSFLARRREGEKEYMLVDKFYKAEEKRNMSLEKKAEKLKERLTSESLEMGKTADPKTGKVSSTHKKTANIQTEIAKEVMLAQRQRR